MKFLQVFKRLKFGKTAWSFIWYAGGMYFFYLCRWLMNIAAARMSASYENAGLLVLAVSITNIWSAFALFSMRNIQVSDINDEFTDSEYVSSRIITALLSTALCIGQVLLFTKGIYQVLVISMYMLFVAGMALADVMHGILQKHWRLGVVGTSYMIKGVVTLSAFMLLLHFWGMLYAVAGMMLLTMVTIFMFDIRFARKYASIKISMNFRRLLPLFKICLPLVIVTFLSFLIPSIARIALEKVTDTETLGIYGSVTLPATIMQTAILATFAPFMNILTKNYKEKAYKRFAKTFWIGAGGITAVFAVFIGVVHVYGAWVIKLLFGAAIVPYAYLFTEASILCFFMTSAAYTSLPLIIFRCNKIIMALYAAGNIVFAALLFPMIRRFSLSGANYVQIIAFAVVTVALFVTVIIIFKREFNKSEAAAE